MLNFRYTKILFAVLLVLLVAYNFEHHVAWYYYLLLVFIYSLVLFWGCYNVGSNFFIPVVCSLKTTKKVIAISFDDGPDATNTPSILQMLKEADVKAAFFCIGNRIADNKAILQQTYNEGHLIANHSYSHHFWFDMFSKDEMVADLAQTDRLVNEAISKTPRLFRPPYGVTNPNLAKAIRKGGYTPIGWNVRSLDTVIKDKDKLFAKVTRKLQPGAIFLFHDTSATTMAILPGFLKYVKSNGYQVVRLDEMLNLQAYA